jgi:hypothetical protein
VLSDPPERVFCQTLVIRLLLVLFIFLPFGAIFVGASVASFDRAEPTWPWVVGSAVWLGLLVWTWRAIGKTRLSIHADGIRRSTIFSTRELRWDEVVEYRYRAIRIYAGGGGLLGAVIEAYASRSGQERSLILSLFDKGRRKLALNSNLKDAAEAVDLAIARVHAVLAPEHERRFALGETLRYGRFEISQRGIAESGDAPTPFADVAEIALTGERLRVKKTGKFFAVASAPMGKIPNVLLFLHLAQLQGVLVPPEL